LLSNILLNELDRELERRGHRFVRYADDANIYVRSHRAGTRVMAGVERFLNQRLKLTLNREKSRVARPWVCDYLGYGMSWHQQPRLRVATMSLVRLHDRLRDLLRGARGPQDGECHMEEVNFDLSPVDNSKDSSGAHDLRVK
jgi:RNA-directed DNA polymerase